MLWEAREEIVGSLSEMFTYSIALGEKPEHWRIAHVVSLFNKMGNKDKSGSCRPVTLMSIVGKSRDCLENVPPTAVPPTPGPHCPLFSPIPNCPLSSWWSSTLSSHRRRSFTAVDAPLHASMVPWAPSATPPTQTPTREAQRLRLIPAGPGLLCGDPGGIETAAPL